MGNEAFDEDIVDEEEVEEPVVLPEEELVTN